MVVNVRDNRKSLTGLRECLLEYIVQIGSYDKREGLCVPSDSGNVIQRSEKGMGCLYRVLTLVETANHVLHGVATSCLIEKLINSREFHSGLNPFLFSQILLC